VRLENKVSIITGGTSGIGRATALLFAREGARVIIAARDESRGKEVEQAILSGGGLAKFVRCNVQRATDCQRVVRSAIEAYGHLDIVFNNAGVEYPDRSVLETAEEEWDQTMDTNAKGVYLMSKYAIPHLVESGGGVIINTASIWGMVAGKGAAAYCASKGAVILLTKAMAIDHAAQGIRVNCICPGSVDTPMLRQEMTKLGGIEKARPIFAARHPLNRISTPEEIARIVLFLASPDASFISGAWLPIDGARTAGEMLER